MKKHWQQLIRWRREWIAVSLLALFVPPVYNYVLTYPDDGLWGDDSYERHSSSLQRDLGFHHGSPFVRLGNSKEEVMALYPVTEGFLYRAGVRNGDIVPDYRSVTAFYQMLEAQGSRASSRVCEGGEGQLSKRDSNA